VTILTGSVPGKVILLLSTTDILMLYRYAVIAEVFMTRCKSSSFSAMMTGHPRFLLPILVFFRFLNDADANLYLVSQLRRSPLQFLHSS
jgi:hypothetical protein